MKPKRVATQIFKTLEWVFFADFSHVSGHILSVTICFSLSTFRYQHAEHTYHIRNELGYTDYRTQNFLRHTSDLRKTSGMVCNFHKQVGNVHSPVLRTGYLLHLQLYTRHSIKPASISPAPHRKREIRRAQKPERYWKFRIGIILTKKHKRIELQLYILSQSREGERGGGMWWAMDWAGNSHTKQTYRAHVSTNHHRLLPGK